MKVCVIGVGYVGLVAGACFAELGNDVICVDNNIEKLNKLKQGIIPIYEPNLEELIKTNVKENRLIFTNNLDEAIKKSLVCFIAVSTPQSEDGSADLKYVYQVANEIAPLIDDYKVIVNKSTVPVGSAEEVTKIIKSKTNIEFDVISNPEFLKQGNAVEDFLKPDRIIIGSNSDRATKIIKDLYEPIEKTGHPIIVMDIKSAELTKYAANSFLALKISYANQIANIAQALGADYEMVRLGICSDERIGNKFLYSGLGFGGSCFPKDLKALTKIAKDNNCDYSLLEATSKINQNQRKIFIEKILKRYNNNINGKTFAVWGLSFKPKTNDMREAPSITIINELLSLGAKIQAYDPKAFECARYHFKDKITYSSCAYCALENADGLLLLTEWNEFKHPDFDKIKGLMKQAIIFDGRNQYNTLNLEEKGFEYFCIGKN